ncbi:glycine zipper domain-containing protein [Aquabacter sp. P-9]|uniref:glycine zipper domain-containing protein n=1 Tax=Aquabacter sediminis TaxID=3029197 RepID=UPI00237EDB92|nr:glycine zipper domain-containing protein [Aquabacter sp. P-9]MDE1568414.1 glycine zipper domain-containing protein [Aquabacter sp. P-9]
MWKKVMAVLLLASCLPGAGVAQDDVAAGAVMGGITGAIIGGAVSGNARGAAAGAVIGGATGAILGGALNQQQQSTYYFWNNGRCYYSDNSGQVMTVPKAYCQ